MVVFEIPGGATYLYRVADGNGVTFSAAQCNTRTGGGQRLSGEIPVKKHLCYLVARLCLHLQECRSHVRVPCKSTKRWQRRKLGRAAQAAGVIAMFCSCTCGRTACVKNFIRRHACLGARGPLPLAAFYLLSIVCIHIALFVCASCPVNLDHGNNHANEPFISPGDGIPCRRWRKPACLCLRGGLPAWPVHLRTKEKALNHRCR